MFSADVAALDAAVKNLTDALASRGMLDHSVIVFTTDNGANLHGGGSNCGEQTKGGCLRGGKWTWWEGGVRGAVVTVQ